MGRYEWVKKLEDKNSLSGEDISVSNSDRAVDFEEFHKRERATPLHIVLDNIRSAYNVGSIFRTADAAGIARLHLCGVTAYPPNMKLEKTSLGSTWYVPWDYYRNTLEAVKALKKQGMPVASLETTDKSINYLDFNFPEPLSLVLGNEINGVSMEIMKESDFILQIPTWGMKNSLNVATAFGIVVYEAVRQYRLSSRDADREEGMAE
ncbi:MAG: RNA methyltransferase [Vulcanimicrobiota bacterium]